MIEARRTDTACLKIDAPPSAVFAAFLDEEAVKAWLPPPGATAEIEAFEPHPGGPFRVTLHFASAPGKTSQNSDRVEATFGELIEDRRLSWNVHFDSPDPRYAGLMVMNWTFDPVGESTLVKVEAQNVPPGISAEDHAQGLEGSLANLARYVEGRNA